MLSNVEARRARIHAYGLGFLRERFIRNHPKYASNFEDISHELKRLLEVMLYAEDRVEITSLAVDALLGEFIAAESAYRTFCQSVYGELLRRVPAPAGYEPGGVYALNFYRLYEDLYTEVPEIWREDALVPA